MHPVIRASVLITLGCVAAITVARCARGGGWDSFGEAYIPSSGSEDGQSEEPESAAKPDPAASVLSILLIGNSHSAPLPRLLTDMAAAAGLEITVQGLTHGGWTLAQHADAPQTTTALHARHHDFVILQDQGQAAAFAEALRRQRLYPAGERLAHAVRAVGSEPWVYAVYARPTGDPPNYPGDTYEAMQTRSDEGYDLLAQRIDARIVPVGKAFRRVRALRPDLPLWRHDGVHASPQGYYLATAVFYAALLDRDPSNVPFDAGLAPEQAAFLRRTAADTVHPSAH